MNANQTPAAGQTGGLSESHGSARDKAWMEIPPLLRGCTDYTDFSEGWKAAFRAIRDRLPAPEFLSDPLNPREVQHLVRFVEEQISPNTPAHPTAAERGVDNRKENQDGPSVLTGSPRSAIPAIQSAALNIGTAARDADNALECWDEEKWEDSVMWINNAIAQLESARAKITAHASSPNTKVTQMHSEDGASNPPSA